MDEPPSSPPTDLSSPEGTIAYYKSQYEQLEHELAEFQASSQELEAELEKDVEAAEKRERSLKEKAESLAFEVDEWKAKYKQSKSEANAAQNILQKEITELRDTSRNLQLRLRDIEVVNDDFERQARNTSSSLEDMESKLNISIERGVMMEEEIKIGEQEREKLRIETQRLRDELSDLRIEAEITQDKLRKRQYAPLTTLSTDITAPNSPSFMGTPTSTASSPMITTPPDTKSVSTADTLSETPTPPSPPISESSATANPILQTPIRPPKGKALPTSSDLSTTPKPTSRYASGSLRSSRGPSALPTPSRMVTPSLIRSTKVKAPATRGLPNSQSLTHIRTLTAQMQKLEQRVHSARSKLPGPVNTPPRASPRNESALGHTFMSANVTIRKKRANASLASSNTSTAGDETPSAKHVSRMSTSGISRLSFGPQHDSRPSSRTSTTDYSQTDRPSSRSEIARPSSRTSLSGSTRSEIPRPSSRTSISGTSRSEIPRPDSRASMSGTRTPLGHYSQSSATESRRPRSSVGGSYGHGHSASVSQIDIDESREVEFTPNNRRSVQGRPDLDDMDTLSASGIPRRRSAGVPNSGLSMTSMPPPKPRRTTSTVDLSDKREMRPPGGRVRKLSGVGETY